MADVQTQTAQPPMDPLSKLGSMLPICNQAPVEGGKRAICVIGLLMIVVGLVVGLWAVYSKFFAKNKEEETSE